MTLFFNTIYTFVIVHHESRRVVHCGVTEQSTDEWVTRQLRETKPFDERAKYLICDNDKKYGDGFERLAKASGIEMIHTPHEALQANGSWAVCGGSA